jgi:hypothetical protein
VFLVVFDVSRRGVISKIPKIGVKIVGSLTGGGGQNGTLAQRKLSRNYTNYDQSQIGLGLIYSLIYGEPDHASALNSITGPSFDEMKQSLTWKSPFLCQGSKLPGQSWPFSTKFLMV